MAVPVPTAMQAIVDLVDQGASSALVMLHILAVGVEYAEQRLTDLRLLRSSDNASVMRLAQLVAETRTLCLLRPRRSTSNT